MMRNLIFYNLSKCRHYKISINKYSNGTLDIEKLEKDTSLQVIDNEVDLREQELEKKRNKSRLSTAHRNILQGKPPYSESMHWSHDTIKYKKKLYGKFGNQAGVDPSLCWPTKEELLDIEEHERLLYPHTVTEMIDIARKKRFEKNERIEKREVDIAQKILKLDTWIKELNSKIAKKEAAAMEAKERKEKLIEEVRRHFGYTVDPRDEKFKEMLERKEKEQKKAMKEARKKAKEEQMISKILSKKGTNENKVEERND